MKALEGIKVVELATFIAVPTVGKFFADQGAEVIKIDEWGYGDFYVNRDAVAVWVHKENRE